jgi:hypothetical protein
MGACLSIYLSISISIYRNTDAALGFTYPRKVRAIIDFDFSARCGRDELSTEIIATAVHKRALGQVDKLL